MYDNRAGDVVSLVSLFDVEDTNTDLRFASHSGITKALNDPQTPNAHYRFIEEGKGKGIR